MTHLTKQQQTEASRCLRVVAAQDTPRGMSECVVPAGTVGYVLGKRVDGETYLVLWDRKCQYKGDWKTGVHPVEHVTVVGRGLQHERR